ncbi:unnamed protein product [Ilex paraguariensis]|uniref:RING-type domain-containing protein n=1 Tax=Ilex paraguariensis TaxID=185542 RepID=A0ABC8U3K1_9AQUA
MGLLTRLRLRRRWSQSPSHSQLSERDSEPETHGSARERKLETETSSSERKRENDVEKEEEEPSERNAVPENSTTTAISSLSSVRERMLRSTDSPPADEISSSETKRETDVEKEPSERNIVAENPTIIATTSLSAVGEIKFRSTDSPPADDCCPICFGSFVIPCRAPCGHWYCGGCILQYWDHGAALQPCNCPMCSQKITSLTPEASLFHQQEMEVTRVLGNVRKYNRLVVGGTYGLILKVLELPFFIKRVFQGMLDPDRHDDHLFKLRFFATFLGILYMMSPFDFLPTGRQSVIELFDDTALIIYFILYVAGIYLRRRRLQRVRELAAIQL